MHWNNIYLFRRESYNYICIFKQLLYFFDNLKLICFLNNKFLLCFLFEFIFKALCCKAINIVYFIVLFKYIIIKILIDSIFFNFIFNIFLYTFTIQFRNLYLNNYFTQFINSNRDNLAIIILFLIQLFLIIDLFLCAIATCDTFWIN